MPRRQHRCQHLVILPLTIITRRCSSNRSISSSSSFNGNITTNAIIIDKERKTMSIETIATGDAVKEIVVIYTNITESATKEAIDPEI